MPAPNARKWRIRRWNEWTPERSRRANAAKARRRLAGPAPDSEPKLVPFHRFEFRVRDRISGDVSQWYEVRSVRDLTRRFSVLLRYLTCG